MINKICFTREWINKVREGNPPADPTIVEKTIYAFELLSELLIKRLDFVFKGGTSLLLLLKNPKRLSIDIDISTNENSKNVESILDEIINSSVFTSWIEDNRKQTKIPKKHYKIFFNSTINPMHNSYILLDVLFQKNLYPKTIRINLKNKFIALDENIKCTLPSVNSLVGDKLTAFAPHTTGIPFGVGKSMQIQKQLFDLGSLFTLISDIDEVYQAFKIFVDIEAMYRDCSFTIDDVKNDILSVSFLISQMQIRKGISNEETKELYEGISKLRSHLIGINYNLETAKIFASQIAFLVGTLDRKEIFEMYKEYSIDKISEKSLNENYRILERIKTVLPEAYYYWQILDKIL